MTRYIRRAERWLPVVGWEGLFEVSSLGRVKNARTGYIFRPTNAPYQRYQRVTLCGKGTKVQVSVSHLVLETFVGPCPDGMEVLHGPAGSRVDRLTNLRWGRPKRTVPLIRNETALYRLEARTQWQDCLRNLCVRSRIVMCWAGSRTAHNASGSQHRDAKLTDAKVLQARELYAAGGASHAKLAARFGVSPSPMRNAITGKTWTHVPMP
jgi:hypothetical protein